MKKVKLHIFTTLFLGVLLFSSCNDFLDQEPDNIYTDEQVFSDLNMINSVVANYYGRVNWGPSLDDNDGHIYTDEAAPSNGGVRDYRTYGDSHWRVYDYGLIRDLNIFLNGLKTSEAAKKNTELSEAVKKRLEGEVRFIRAWTYFNMVKTLGGVPIVEDQIWDYDLNSDVLDMQVPRSTEAETYDYIIEECRIISEELLANSEFNAIDKNVGASRANKWSALALKARAAVYAGSIAKYTTASELRLPGGEVGIPAASAEKYYKIAYESSLNIKNNGPYSLYKKNASDKQRNFYDAIIDKSNNPEVIWALDYKSPGKVNSFTRLNIAYSVKGDVDANFITPILNIVEAFEYEDSRDGKLELTDNKGDYIYYDNMEDVFKGKDARMFGTIITPGSSFRGTRMTYQAGQKYLENGKWTTRVGTPGNIHEEYGLITDQNGPVSSDQEFISKTGFNIRKFIDENKDASTRGRNNDVWFTRFRYAETLLILAESALELGKPQQEVCSYINEVRERGGIQPLTSVTLDDIIRENRVEFVYENHRYWDAKRWRIAHLIWNNDDESDTSRFYSLFPYQINQPGHAQHGKWVFEKVRTYTTRYPRFFQMKNYYNFFDQGWLNRNPKLVKNPYQ